MCKQNNNNNNKNNEEGHTYIKAGFTSEMELKSESQARKSNTVLSKQNITQLVMQFRA